MSVLYHHFEEYQEFLPLDAALWFRETKDLVVSMLRSTKFKRGIFGTSLSGQLLIYPPENIRMENILNGRKPKRDGSQPSNGNGKPSTFRWVNIPLTSQDELILEQETADIELLSSSLIQLVVRGFGVSVKYDNARKSYNCSIYGCDLRNNMQPCGISGSASDVRDAILVSLYRFNTCLQGSFDGSTLEDTTFQPKRFK